MDNKKKEKEIKYIQYPTSISDIVKIAPRKDGTILLQFLSETPDFLFENHRTLIMQDIAIQLVDLLSDATNYHPEKPQPKK